MSSSSPRPRVRRSFDFSPEESTPLELKLRPFVEIFNRGRGLPALVMRGEIEDGDYVVHVGLHPGVKLDAQLGRDEHGAFATAAVQRHALGRSHALRVEADACDQSSSHAALTYLELPRHAQAREETAYASSWFSVFFNPRGLVDGSSFGGPQSIAPGAPPS